MIHNLLLLPWLLLMPQKQMAKEMTAALMPFIRVPVRQAVKTPGVKAVKSKRYRCVFSGQVTCGGQLCEEADVKVSVQSKKNAPREKTVRVGPDGSYELSFILKENVNENLDWWISIDSPESAPTHVQGREILRDGSDILIERSIPLL